MIKKREVVKVEVSNLYCDNCGALMERQRMFYTDPLVYHYECPKCGEMQETKEKFPEFHYTYADEKQTNATDETDTADIPTTTDLSELTD
jgi:DNA-directed RNA polymerase subunit M/transcription elongation factor TFIIS